MLLEIVVNFELLVSSIHIYIIYIHAYEYIIDYYNVSVSNTTNFAQLTFIYE